MPLFYCLRWEFYQKILPTQSFVRKQRCGRCQRSHQPCTSHSIQIERFKILSNRFVRVQFLCHVFRHYLPLFFFKFQTESLFEILKAHLKRAPSLKGAALVKLSQLKVQAYNWPVLRNVTEIAARLDHVEITSDDWFRNVLNIYKAHKSLPKYVDLSMNNDGQTS